MSETTQPDDMASETPADPTMTPERLAWVQPAAPKPPADSNAPAPGAGWPEELGGPRGLEPTRYGDWEQNGICRDF